MTSLEYERGPLVLRETHYDWQAAQDGPPIKRLRPAVVPNMGAPFCSGSPQQFEIDCAGRESVVDNDC